MIQKRWCTDAFYLKMSQKFIRLRRMLKATRAENLADNTEDVLVIRGYLAVA